MKTNAERHESLVGEHRCKCGHTKGDHLASGAMECTVEHSTGPCPCAKFRPKFKTISDQIDAEGRLADAQRELTALAMVSNTSRGIGPEAVAKVARCIRASLAFQESDSLAAHNKASAELRDALALLPEPR